MIKELNNKNKEMQGTVNLLQTKVEIIAKENKMLKNTLLDVQSRSMRDNLIFKGIKEDKAEDTEAVVKDFMMKEVKIPVDQVQSISFHRVHRLGGNLTNSTTPRAIVAKFEHFKQKEMVKNKGRELQGTNSGMNDQFPREIMELRKKLYPVMRENRKNCQATIVVDTLDIEGPLFRDLNVTP
ncbi:UNVERIFIED_CONTAM: hypothetical protein FKN15_043799 [Acipenser sinensis]